MKPRITYCGVVLVVLVASAGVQGAIISPTPVSDLNALLGPSPTQATSLMITPMDDEYIGADTYSQVFTNGTDYAYLYQVDNTGDHKIEHFTVFPFAGADLNTQVGWFTSAAPTGFLAEFGNVPYGVALDTAATDGPLYSWSYWDTYGVVTGDQSVVMYIVSDLPPDVVLGNVINGNVANGPVYGPVPEPATMILLGLGGAALLGRRRRH